ncbi:carboxypeptidase-like regulatory domain-containing protein [uncultured Croceitalea sp.]|uniref:carboxypeptidase-like regulatory domain-containing protein n=1 Tax=uncultured Croceitalea sp. TaxID=1798908 RepID=UPI00330570C5
MARTIVLLFLLTSNLILAQKEIITTKGQLLDSETSQPIPFASIYLKNRTIGTTSNSEGYFVFHIPVQNSSGTIVISAMGYASIERMPDSFSSEEKIVLEPQINRLDEVQLSASKDKVLTAKEIVRKAHKRIGENYPTEPYILEGFVRDLQKEDDSYVEYLECAAKYSYQGTQIKREPSIELLGVRSNGIAEKHPWNKNTERKNSLIDLVEDDFIRFNYGPILGKKGWKYKIENALTYDNRLVYKIAGVEKPFQTATLYIDAKTFAFVRMELTRKAIKNRSWRRRFTNGALQIYYNVVFEYQEYKGKMYLKYQKEEDHWRIFKGLESNKVLFTKYPKKELFINNIITENVANYPFKRNMEIGNSIENQAEKFDTEFWATYNIPQQTAEQSKILKELKNKIH